MRIEASADYHGIASRGACSGPGNEVIAYSSLLSLRIAFTASLGERLRMDKVKK